MSDQRPHRRVRITIEIEADSWESASRMLEIAKEDLDAARPSPGDPLEISAFNTASDFRLKGEEDPEVTRESYLEARHRFWSGAPFTG